MAFIFEKLVLYQEAISFAEKTSKLTKEFPRGSYYLSDQLNRAVTSISLNISEGNGSIMKKVLFCLIIVFLICVNQKVYACSCADPGDPLSAFSKADVVFAGKVSTMKELENSKYAVTFEVSQHFKGATIESLLIYTPLNGKSCGFPFEIGNEYLVYGNKFSSKPNKSADEILVSHCGRTRELSDAQEDLTAFKNKLKNP